MKTRILLMLAALLLLLPVVGLAQDEPPVVLAVSTQPDSLFPDFARAAVSGYAYSVIYNKLVTTGEDGNPAPDLAESWETSEDGRTWTLHLREAVLWHDGEPFTAEDVKFMFEFRADPNYGGTAFDPSIEGAQEKKDGEATEVSGVQVIDDYTISITTVEPTALFLQTIASTEVVPSHILQDIPIAEYASSSLARAPIGTGPYRLAEWVPDQSLTYEAFDGYFGEPANIDTVIWRIVPEPATQVTELITGGVNVLSAVSADDADLLITEQNVVVNRLTGTGVNYIMINHNNPLFADVRTRQALSYAIDTQAILDAISGGYGTIGTSSVFPELPEANSELVGYPYNPERASALLAEAGWADTDGNGVLEASGVEGVEDGTPFHVVITTYTTPAWTSRAQVVQQFLQQIGVETEVNTMEANALFAQYLTATSEYDLILSGWVNLLIPTLSDLVVNFRSGETNAVVLRWGNEEADALMDAIPTIFDDEERIAAFWRVQEIIEQEVPVIYLDRPAANIAYSTNLVIPEVGSVIDLFASVPQWQWGS